MVKESSKRDISFIEAFVLLLSYVGIFAYGIGKFPTGMSILMCMGITATYGVFVLKYTWDELFGSIMEMFKMGLPAIFVLLIVGFISSSWIASGTIPTLIVYGLKVLNPSIFLVATFLVTAIVSIATGSSWSTVATFGVALMGVAQGMGIPVGLAGGAIVSGCWLGDKWSPLSDTTNLAAAVTGKDVFDVFKYNFPTSGFGGIGAAIVFAVIGMGYAGSNIDTARIDSIIVGIENVYTINPILLLPIIIVIVLSVMKKPVLPALTLATVTAVILAMTVQGSSFVDNINWLYNGIVSETGVVEVDKLLSGGGLLPVAPITMIIFCALFLAGVLNKMGVMPALVSMLGALTKTRGMLIVSTVITSIAGAYLGGTAYTGVIFSAGMYEKAFEKLGLTKLDLARTVLEGAGHTSALVPWCGSHVIILSSIGVAWTDFLPYYYSFWISIALTVIYGFTGLFTTKAVKSEEAVTGTDDKVLGV